MKTLLFCLLCLSGGLSAQVLLPGDANNDGRVNHLDVLALGLSYGQKGPPRPLPFQGFSWSPKFFIPWPGGLPATGINHAFSDCDGDSIVGPKDVLALKINYDSMHMASQPPPEPYFPPDTFATTALPRLVFKFDKDTATVRDTLRLHIFYQHPPGLTPAEAPLGVAFTLEFDEHLVKDSLTSVFFEPAAEDLMFAAGATAFADARTLPPGRVEFGTAGRGVPGLGFSRPLGVVQFIIEDVIVRADTFWTIFNINTNNHLMINMKEQVVAFQAVPDHVVLYQPLSQSAASRAALPVRCYPSPFHDRLHIATPEATLSRLEVFDSQGRRIAVMPGPHLRETVLNTAAWPGGAYIIVITGVDGRTGVRRVFKS